MSIVETGRRGGLRFSPDRALVRPPYSVASGIPEPDEMAGVSRTDVTSDRKSPELPAPQVA